MTNLFMTKNTDSKITKKKKLDGFYYPMNNDFKEYYSTNSYSNTGKQITTCNDRIQNIKHTEKTDFKDKLALNKEVILKLWIDSTGMSSFMKKFQIKDEDQSYYIKYFGNKVLEFLADNFGETKSCSDIKYIFLTTKFFDYIKGKGFGIDDLLKIIIILKNIIIKNINGVRKISNEITIIFDNIGVILSKEYNSTAIKLLNEYNNAIDKSNIIAKINIGGKITYVNDECCKLSGYSKKELIGLSYEEFGILNENMSIKEILKIVNDKKILRGIIKSIKKKGDFYWLKVTIVPIVDENNNVLEHICIMTDITDIELAREQLNRSLDTLKELDIKKDEFLNIASHELRTPMTSIRGYISMILDGDAGKINPNVKTYLEQVYNNATRLITLINNMLDVSKLEAEQQEFTIKKIHIKTLLIETYNEIKQLFIDKEQSLKIDIKFDGYCNTDEDKLKQVIINLLGNSNKFSPEKTGKIKLISFKKNKKLYISIIDNGIGIDKKHFKVIFEKFGQIKNSLTRDNSGSGLGLSIANFIIDRLGGKIEVKSKLGKGTKFTIILPIKS